MDLFAALAHWLIDGDGEHKLLAQKILLGWCLQFDNMAASSMITQAKMK
jgi:hypothetical protein